jgi:hypothetical protein
MGLTALAIVIQMGVLIALFVSFQKASERLQSLLPMIRDTKILLAEATPKVREVLYNLAARSATARQDAERISLTANEITDHYSPAPGFRAGGLPRVRPGSFAFTASITSSTAAPCLQSNGKL